MFSANLRLMLSAAEKKSRVESLIVELGLVKCSNTRIGNNIVRGVSGGERKRASIGVELLTNPSLVFLDEPTTGLHLADVDKLLALLDRLVEDGNTVIVIEHNLAVMAHADWILDLGPGAGHDGGQVVFEGSPSDLVADGATLTGQHLRGYVG